MNITGRLLLRIHGLLAASALLLCSGCITVPKSVYENSTTYEPIRTPVTLDGSASIEATDTLAPEMRAIWKRWLNNDNSIANYLDCVTRSIRNDLATSGLFTTIVDAPGAAADYHVKAVCIESKPSDFRFSVTITVTDKATGAVISAHTREHSYGTSMFGVKYKEAAPPLMAALKADIIADFQAIAQRRQQEQEKNEMELFTKATLTDLLVSSEKSIPLARARNRAIVAAKTTQLPDILRNWKTADITALIVRVEQTILDLNHECEIAKDAAQQGIAEGGANSTENPRPMRGDSGAANSAAAVDSRRDLSISYRERIELLKPILAALKEELANRNS